MISQIIEQNQWNLVEAPRRLSGGYLHKIYFINTINGPYVVKLLNPEIMRRDTAMENFQKAEELEMELEMFDIPIVAANVIHGKKMQKCNSQYYYVYDYFDGSALKNNISPENSRKVGASLAKIHMIDAQSSEYKKHFTDVDWKRYIRVLENKDKDLSEKLSDCYDMLLQIEDRNNNAQMFIPNIQAICHNDMDPKNVLWHGEEMKIIDLESLSKNNPYIELIETMLSWSETNKFTISPKLMLQFLTGYKTAGGEVPDDWEPLYDCNYNQVEWLEYNLKRTADESLDASERMLGKNIAMHEIDKLSYRQVIREQMLQTLTNLSWELNV